MRKKEKKSCSVMRMCGFMIFFAFLLGACSTQDGGENSEETYQSNYTEPINYIEKYNKERQEALDAILYGNESSQFITPESNPTPKPTEKVEEKPDESDMYVAAMDYIDDAVSKASVSKKYSGYSYKIKDKKIKKGNNGLGVVYNVSFIIEFNGVLQKYRVDVQLSPMRDYLMGGYTYYVTDSNVYYNGSTFLDY